MHTDYTAVQGAGVTRTLLTSTESPSAIIYDNDAMAVAELGVASEFGIDVPRDLSVIAWDDSPLCEATYPKLSALSHDVTRHGAHVARRLFDRMDGIEPGSFLDSVPTLRTRGSTAHHRASSSPGCVRPPPPRFGSRNPILHAQRAWPCWSAATRLPQGEGDRIRQGTGHAPEGHLGAWMASSPLHERVQASCTSGCDQG